MQPNLAQSMSSPKAADKKEKQDSKAPAANLFGNVWDNKDNKNKCIKNEVNQH